MLNSLQQSLHFECNPLFSSDWSPSGFKKMAERNIALFKLLLWGIARYCAFYTNQFLNTVFCFVKMQPE